MRCKICKGPLGLMGRLGNLKHYRCRNCGMTFNRSVVKFAAKSSKAPRG